MDLRNYFSAKPKTKPAASAPAAEAPKPEPEKKRQGRKKTVIPESDDEDEVVQVKSKHFSAPPKAAPAKKAAVTEEIDPSTFFATAKVKKTPQATSSQPAPVSAKTAKEESKESKAKAVEVVETPLPAKRAKKAADDDFFEDLDEDLPEVIVKPKPRAAPTKAVPEPRPVEKPKAVEASPKKAAPSKRAPASNQKKRKGGDDSDDGDDYVDIKDEAKEVVKPTKRHKAAPKKTEDDMDVDEPVLTEEKPKKFNYWAHKNKAGPSAIGSKDIPTGQDNCLAGYTFVFTGELSSITREDATDLVKRYSGRVTGSPSGKTSFVVVGDDAGQSKLDKVKKLKIKTLDEDQFLELIATEPAKTEDGKPAPASKSRAASSSAASSKVKAEPPVSAAPSPPPPVKAAATQAKSSSSSTSKPVIIETDGPVESELWTTKYRPKQMKDLCGNAAAIQRLERWLKDWHSNYKLDFKKDNADKTGTFRSVLISGPPGVGKTSAAHLVAESLGYNVVEFNASDTRSKKSLDNEVRDLLNNQSLAGYFHGEAKEDSKGKGVVSQADPTMGKKQLIIMDEVDGMAGGDRGGVAQLIAFIKKTQVPIICICNDRQSVKVRSLVNSCFDMRFQRPQAAQVRSRLLSILHKEGRQVPGNVLDKLVTGSQSDIRQVLNMLSTWSLTEKTMDYDQGTALSKKSEKYIALNPFQIADNLLVETNYRSMSTADKFDAYFHDYQLAPLMIQENYVRMNPTEARNDGSGVAAMDLMSKAADSLSDADLVDSMIHGSVQHWSLMPVHAAFSCVRPSFFVHGNPRSSGHFGPMMQFPSYLGQNSKATKYNRLVKDVQIRMRLKISGDKNEVRQSYLPALFPALTKPLVNEGVDAIPALMEFMDSYYLSREDWDTVLELGIGRNDGKAILDKIPSATKAAFTRKYNATAHPQPFLKPTVATKGRGSSGGGGGGGEEAPDNLDVIEADVAVPDEAEEEDPDADGIDKDKNIKQKKVKGAPAAKSAGSSAKGKGKSVARGKK